MTFFGRVVFVSGFEFSGVVDDGEEDIECSVAFAVFRSGPAVEKTGGA